MNMQNGHDVKVHTLNPTDNGILQAKLTEVHPSDISWHPLLAEIFNSPISAGMYHVQRVAILVLCDANQFKLQIRPWSRYATLCKTAYFCQCGLILNVGSGLFMLCCLLLSRSVVHFFLNALPSPLGHLDLTAGSKHARRLSKNARRLSKNETAWASQGQQRTAQVVRSSM